jgi:hypothetical protein
MGTHHLLAVLAFGFCVGCGGKVAAPRTADGGRVTIYLLSDRGLKQGMTQQEQDERNELGAWMEQDLARILKEGGYDVVPISSKESFTPAKNAFMLTFAIEHYRPGRMSTREEAGFGEGVVEIDTYIELYKDNPTLPVLQKKQGSASGRNWRFCAGDVNKKTAPAVSERINELN